MVLVFAAACTATSGAAAKSVPLSPTPVIARVRSEPCLDTQMIPTPDNLDMVDEATLCLVDQERAQVHEMASPEHRANILETRYRGTAIGVALGVPASFSGGAPGATYTEDFGVIYG
jgi:hypothetical protein